LGFFFEILPIQLENFLRVAINSYLYLLE